MKILKFISLTLVFTLLFLTIIACDTVEENRNTTVVPEITVGDLEQATTGLGNMLMPMIETTRDVIINFDFSPENVNKILTDIDNFLSPFIDRARDTIIDYIP